MSTEEPKDPSGLSGGPVSAPPEKTNWKPVYAAIAIVIALSIITVLWINRPGTQVTNPPPSQLPSPSQTSVSTPTPSPSPSPTLDEREAAIAEAKEAYQNYTDAYSAMAKGGSSKALTEKVHPYTTGRNWKTVKREAAEYREAKISVKGEPTITFRKSVKVDLAAEPPTIRMTVCLDSTPLKVTDGAGSSLPTGYILSQATMQMDQSSWKLADREDAIQEKSCAR